MLGIVNDILKPTLIQNVSRIKVYNALTVSFFYMKAKFGPLEKKKDKKNDWNHSR
jgi:hypothetical protein